MPDFLHDPRYYGPIATSCAVLVTLGLWFLSQRRKQLAYEVLSNVSLLNVVDEVKEQLRVHFDGTPESDMHVVVMKIVNSGDIAIRSSEYEGKLTIVFERETRVLSAEVEETSPKNLHERSLKDNERKPLIELVRDTEVVMRPVMLNKGDFMKVRLLVNKPPGEPELVGHIEGIHDIRKIKRIGKLPIGIASHLGTHH